MSRFRQISGGDGRFTQIEYLGLSASVPVGVVSAAGFSNGLPRTEPVTFAFEFLPVAGETILFDIGADSTDLGLEYSYTQISVGGAAGNEIDFTAGARLPIAGGDSALEISASAPLGVRSLVVASLVPAGEARLWINGSLAGRVDGGDAIPLPGWAGGLDGALAVSAGGVLTGGRIDVYAGQFPQRYWDGA